MSFASSSVGSNVVPNFKRGHLVARHVETLNEDALNCRWCNEPFEKGQKVHLDVYREDPDNPHSPSQLVLFHANAPCLPGATDLALVDQLGNISFAGKSLASDTSKLIARAFGWTLGWIDWHYRFVKDGDIHLTLPSKRSALTEEVAPSFSFEITKNHAAHELAKIQAPWELLTHAFWSGMFTTVHVYDLRYTGIFNPVLQLQQAFDSQKFELDLDAYAHGLPSTKFVKGGSSHQSLRLIFKTRPTAMQVKSVMQYIQDNRHKKWTWGELLLDLPFVEAHAEKQSATLAGIHNCIVAAGIELPDQDQRQKHIISFIEQAQETPIKTNVWLVSNLYFPTKLVETRYYFHEGASNDEQPLYCYEGLAKQPMPVLFTDLPCFEVEMKESNFKNVEMTQLTLLVQQRTQV